MCIQHSARFVVTLPSSCGAFATSLLSRTCMSCIIFGLHSVRVCPPRWESLSVARLSSSVSLHSLSWLQTVPEDLSNIMYNIVRVCCLGQGGIIYTYKKLVYQHACFNRFYRFGELATYPQDRCRQYLPHHLYCCHCRFHFLRTKTAPTFPWQWSRNQGYSCHDSQSSGVDRSLSNECSARLVSDSLLRILMAHRAALVSLRCIFCVTPPLPL